MADDDWLFGANKVDEKLVIGEPEETGRHGSTPPQRTPAMESADAAAMAQAQHQPATEPQTGIQREQVQAAARMAAQAVAQSMMGGGTAAPARRGDPSTPQQSGVAAESPVTGADARVATPTPPQSRPSPAPQPVASTAPPRNPSPAPQPVEDNFDPWADDAQDVDDSWTLDADGTPPQSRPSPVLQNGGAAPPQSVASTTQAPIPPQPRTDTTPLPQPAGDDWFNGGAAQRSPDSTPPQGVGSPAPAARPDTTAAPTSTVDDDWFNGGTDTAGTGAVEEERPAATPPQSVPSTPQSSTPGDDDWFTAPSQSTAATPPQSRDMQTADDDWFNGSAATQGSPSLERQSVAATPPQYRPAPAPRSTHAMPQDSTPGDDDWFGTPQPQSAATPSQSPAAMPPESRDATAPQIHAATTGAGYDPWASATPQTARNTPQAHEQPTPAQPAAPVEAAASRPSTPPQSQPADDWFNDNDTPAPQADDWATPTQTMPETQFGDPWAGQPQAGEWTSPAPPMQAQSTAQPQPQPASYAPAATPQQNPDIEEGDNDRRSIWKPFLTVIACVLALALIGFGGYYAYGAYHRNMETRARQESSQQALKALDKSKASYEADRKQARTLAGKMCNGIVKDDPDVIKQAEALDRLASLSMPRTSKAIGEADATLNKQYRTASETYQSKVKAKCDTVSKTLADLASQSDQLASAPDSTEKTTMQSLAKKWRDRTVTEDSYADAVKAQTDLQNAVNAVQAAKAQADAAAQQAQQQAEAQAQAQAQAQQQQQAQKKSTTTRKRSSSSGSTTKRYSSGGPTRRQQSTPQQTTVPQPAPQPAQPSTPSGESGVNLG